MQNLLERSTELHVEDGVDDRVEEAVHVAEPDEEREEHRVDLTDGVLVEQIVADADGVDDVDGEERNPTQQEHACNQQHTSQSTRHGRSQKFVVGWYKFLLYNTAVRYTSSLTSSAAISAQHNFQGLILGGYIYRYTPPRSLRPCYQSACQVNYFQTCSWTAATRQYPTSAI